MSWVAKPLSEILDQSGRHRAGDQDLPVLSITMKYGLVDQAEKFKKRVASSDTSNYRIAYKNELVVGFPIDEGVLGFQTKYPAGIVSPAYDIWRLKKEADCHIPYLERYLRSSQARSLYASRMQGAVARRRSLTKTDFLNLEIPFPPLDDQIRIAHLLDKVEGLIAQRKQHLQQLDDLLKSVFLEMFGDPVRNEMGWEPTTMGDNVEIQSGQVDPRRLPYSELPHVGGANIESESGNLVELKQAKYENLISGKYLFDSTYILYSKIRPYLNKVSKPDFQGVCSADIYPIKPIAGLLNRDFLRMLLMSKAFLNYTANNSDRANIPKINRKALVAFGFNRPPIALQNQFATIAAKIGGLKSRYQQSLSDLEALYGALSQQAFKGELDLARVPLSRPADETPVLTKQANMEPTTPAFFQLPDPEAPDWLALENRPKLIDFWLTAWCERYAEEPFAVSRFLDAAYQQLVELSARDAFQFDKPGKGFDEAKWYEEPAPFGINEYEQIKEWVFDALASGKLTQGFDDADNRIQLKAAQA